MISAAPEIPAYAQRFARYRGDSAQPKLWDGLVGLWAPFLGPTGLTLFDWSSYGNHGTLTGMEPATDWITAPHGRGLQFSSNDYVRIPDAPSLDITGDIAVNIWLRLEGSAPEYVIAKRDGNNSQYGIHGGSDKKPAIYSWNSPNTSVAANTPLAVDEWEYRVVSVQGGTASWYRNGVPDGSGPLTPITTAASDLFIGCRGNGVGGGIYFFTGAIWQVQIYRRAMTAREIAFLNADPFALLRPRRVFVGIAPLIGRSYWIAVSQTVQAGAVVGQTFNSGQTAGQIDGGRG